MAARTPEQNARYQANRNAKAQSEGWSGYGQKRYAMERGVTRVRPAGPRYGPTARSNDMGATDLDTTSAKRRLHEAVRVTDDTTNDWENEFFSSSRVASGRYSPSRRQLILSWVPDGRPSPQPDYVYDDIPPAVWTGFRTTGSQGQFVNHTLNNFPYRPFSGN
jgi:hypothetical protein